MFVPRDVKRYFISHEEAAHLCLLSTFCCRGEVLVPKIPEEQLTSFTDIAKIFVKDYLGREPVYYEADDISGKRDHMKEIIRAGRAYPVVTNKTDTSGEKLYEEFFTEDNNVDFSQFTNIGVLKLKDLYGEPDDYFYGRMLNLSKNPTIENIHAVVPDFQHVASDKNLDQRA